MKKAIALLLPLALLASTVSCAEKKPNSSSDTATESEIEIASDSTVKDHGPKYQRYASMTPEEIVGELTLEQKANQMVQPAVYNITADDMKANDYGSILSTVGKYKLNNDNCPYRQISSEHINTAHSVDCSEYAVCSGNVHKRRTVYNIQAVEYIGVDGNDNGHQRKHHSL